MKHIRLFASVLAACAALLVSCKPEEKPGDTTVEVAEVTLSKTELTIENGESETLTATVLPSNATDKTVTWTSSKPAVAEVSATGVVTAKSEGEAVITAKSGSKTATCNVTVVKPALVITGDASYITWTTATLSFKVNLGKAEKYTTYDAGITLSKTDGELAPGTTEYADLLIEKDKDGNPDISGDYHLSAWNLEANTTYYYRAWALFDDQIVFGDKRTFDSATLEIETEQMVDLGLSVKWAGYNVGATKPEEFGDYFAWGMTKPSSNGYYTWAEYDLGGSAILYKYISDEKYGTPDGRTTLMACDDAASVNWGENWRMPTVNEKREFLMNTTNTAYVYNGVPGFIFTSKVNNKSIFIPNAGVMIGSEKVEAGEQCGFWTSELSTSDNRYAHIASNKMDDPLFHDAGFDMDATGSAAFNLRSGRPYGRSVRAVYGDPIADEPYTLTTKAAEEITALSAKVAMEISPDATASEKGIIYGCYKPENTMEPLPGLGQKAIVDASGVAILKNLAPNYLVKARAYAYIDGKIYLGNTITFTTTDMAGLAVSSAVSDLTHESAVLNGKIGDLGYIKSHYTEIETGIRWRATYPGYEADASMSYATDVVLTPDASGTMTTTITGLTRFSEYYYRAYVKLDGSYYYGETVTFKTLEEPVPDFVDLGLSVLWAGKNLGAASAEIRGTQVAWGETSAKESYSGNNYKYRGASLDSEPTKYNSVDGKTVLDPGDDAATAALGSDVRTPSPAEFKELMDNVTVTVDWYNGTQTMVLTSKINGNHIYMPYGYAATYWTNTLSEYVGSAIGWRFHSSGIEKVNSLRSVGDVGESKGNMVRPVKTK